MIRPASETLLKVEALFTTSGWQWGLVVVVSE